MNIIKTIKINIRYIAKQAFRFLTDFITLCGFVATLTPIDGLLYGSQPLCIRFTISILIFLSIYTAIFIVVAICVEKRKQFMLFKTNKGYKVYLQFGDIFAGDFVSNQNERQNILIPVNRCFDTKVDDRLISNKSLHGMIIKKLTTSGKYTESELNSIIKNQLNSKECDVIRIEKKDKPEGNLNRYPIGTTVEISDGNKVYYLFALTEFDKNLNASINNLDYMTAINEVTNLCKTKSQGYPFILPLIGNGLSMVDKSPAELLSYIVQSLRFNSEKIRCDIYIVVLGGLKSELPIYNII